MPVSSTSPDAGPVARWRALTARDRLRLLAFVALLPIIDLSLRLLGLARTQRLLRVERETATNQPTPADALADGETLARLAAIAGRRGLYANTCLRQALAVQWWLQRRGLPAQLRVGGSVVQGSLRAHAWVELDGHALAQQEALPPLFC